MRRTVVGSMLVLALLGGYGAAPARAAERPPAVDTVDPGLPGPYATVTGEYTLPDERIPGLATPVEMRAIVVAPRAAPGARPMVLILHGMHPTCFRGADRDRVTARWPCPPGSAAIPSYRGYLPEQRLLASQGYLTVSVSADAVNAQDDGAEGGIEARSALLRRQLAHWASWAGAGRARAPRIVRAIPPADLSRVVLVGHSRGGEGANRATMDSLTPPPAGQDGYAGPVRWTVRGTLLVAPVSDGQDPVADVPSVTMLPGCDGDVSTLSGQLYVDATRGVGRTNALHSAVYLVGANHNFFNTEWTAGTATAPAFDDAANPQDPVCAPRAATRLTAAQQLRAASTYFAAAVRLFVHGDDAVRPLLDGSGVRAASAGPARVLSHALGGNRTPVIVPGPGLRVGGSGRLCAQTGGGPLPSCRRGMDMPAAGAGHFYSFGVPEPDRLAIAMRWSAPGQALTMRPARPVPTAGAAQLALRLIVPPGSARRFRVLVTDPAGRRTELGETRVDGLPAPRRTPAYWAQEVRVPLRGDGPIATLQLVPLGGPGRAWLLDAWAWRPGLGAGPAGAPPRVDLGELRVAPGAAGSHRIPVTVTGSGVADVRFFLTGRRPWVVHLRPGDRRVDVPVTLRRGGSGSVRLWAKAVRNAMVGDFSGGLTVGRVRR